MNDFKYRNVTEREHLPLLLNSAATWTELRHSVYLQAAKIRSRRI